MTLLRDLDDDLSLAKDRIVDTVFIGGGTPSLFQVSAIDVLLRGIKNSVTLSVDAEITLEANPGSAEADKFIGLKEAGINRLSIGVQSFADAQLNALGRVHDGSKHTGPLRSRGRPASIISTLISCMVCLDNLCRARPRI